MINQQIPQQFPLFSFDQNQSNHYDYNNFKTKIYFIGKLMENYSHVQYECRNNTEQILLKKCHDLIISKQQIENILNFTYKIFEEMRKQISILLQDECTLEAFPYGSFLQGTCFKNSDGDFTILLSRSNGEIIQFDEALKIIQYVCDVINQQQYEGIKCKTKHGFLVPLTKVKDIKNNIKIDIVYNNLLGVFNSLLLSNYFWIDPKIKYVCILFKQWAKVNEFNKKFILTSYALINMVIFFFIEKQYIFSLQDYNAYGYQQEFIKTVHQKRQCISYEVDIGFMMDKTVIQKKASRFFTVLQQKSLSDLFEELFELYKHYLQDSSSKYISIKPIYLRNIIVSDDQKINIEDPFDNTYNPGSRGDFKMDEFLYCIKEGPIKTFQ